jgi:hypothetical protein
LVDLRGYALYALIYALTPRKSRASQLKKACLGSKRRPRGEGRKTAPRPRAIGSRRDNNEHEVRIHRRRPYRRRRTLSPTRSASMANGLTSAQWCDQLDGDLSLALPPDIYSHTGPGMPQPEALERRASCTVDFFSKSDGAFGPSRRLVRGMMC